jgi:hypothetical protein
VVCVPDVSEEGMNVSYCTETLAALCILISVMGDSIGNTFLHPQTWCFHTHTHTHTHTHIHIYIYSNNSTVIRYNNV